MSAMTHHAGIQMNHAASVTYASAASAVAFWGLHLADIAVILSAVASIGGVALQAYVAYRQLRNDKSSRSPE